MYVVSYQCCSWSLLYISVYASCSAVYLCVCFLSAAFLWSKRYLCAWTLVLLSKLLGLFCLLLQHSGSLFWLSFWCICVLSISNHVSLLYRFNYSLPGQYCVYTITAKAAKPVSIESWARPPENRPKASQNPSGGQGVWVRKSSVQQSFLTEASQALWRAVVSLKAGTTLASTRRFFKTKCPSLVCTDHTLTTRGKSAFLDV